LVEKPLSSTKTSRAGFSPGCAACQALRAAATSRRSCSAARCDFFVCQAKPVERVPQAADAHRDAPRLGQPGAQFLERRVGALAHPLSQRRRMRGKLRRPYATPRPRLGLAVIAPSRQRRVNVRYTDPQQHRSLGHRPAVIDHPQHPVPQLRTVRKT
jgi:hypothetical protein